MTKHFIIFSLCFFGLYLFCSCNKEERNNAITRQEQSIDNYVNTKKEDSILFNNGVYRIIKTLGSGEELAAGDSLYFYYAMYIFNNGKGDLCATNRGVLANEKNFTTDTLVKRVLFNKGTFIEGLFSGLSGVKAGEQSEIVFSSKYGFNDSVVYNIDKNTPLFIEVWIDKIIKN